nr:uncharacterized protein LOC116772016 [Danaus plexippus plexippus]
MDCLACPANASLVTSTDGFGCSCSEHSVPSGISKCKPCNITEIVSSDGNSCVSRRCQSAAGRIVCRKCPNDYISVTQNFDGSPMKEVQCVKCARGYKAVNNRCVWCEACSCKKYEIVVKGNCIPRKYVLDRPKYSENILHPDEVLEFIKLEYLCTVNYRACRSLASVCVRNHYTYHPAGPCRLWIQSNLTSFKGLPLLTTDDFKNNKADLALSLSMKTLDLTLATHTSDGGFKIFHNTNKLFQKCLPSMKIKIGAYFRRECVRNVSEVFSTDYGDIFEIYVQYKETLKSLPIVIRKPSGYYVDNARHLLRIDRDVYSEGALKVQLLLEIQYALKHPSSDTITTSIIVEHQMPDAGVTTNLEISGAVLSSIFVVYSLVQWRGATRRGANHFIIVPLFCGYLADALYIATFISSLHALCSEAGTLSVTLPLSKDEEHLIRSMIYAVLSMKFLKVLWIHWNQCRCEVIFIDWSQYNPLERAPSIKENYWKIDLLVSELMSMQTKRRVPPSYTVTITVFALYLLNQYESYPSNSQGYKWVMATLVWWIFYCCVSLVFILKEKFFTTNTTRLGKLCINLEISLLVFQYEYYAHYVNGRNDDLEMRSISHTLPHCRLICSPHLRNAFVKLKNSSDYIDGLANQTVLSQFLGAFFERALDGLSWVANERTVLERLLDIELTEREGGNTSILLYDNNVSIPSLFSTTCRKNIYKKKKKMVFGCILIASEQYLLAALLTAVVWRIKKCMRMFFSYWTYKGYFY